MNVLFILNEPPYGSENTYNALRLAMAIQKDQPETHVRVFLMADSVTAAATGQSTPQGYYNVERMLKSVSSREGHIALCGTCCQARGVDASRLVEGVEMGTMGLLAQWTAEADKILVF